MDEVKFEARRRKVDLLILPMDEAIETLARLVDQSHYLLVYRPTITGEAQLSTGGAHHLPLTRVRGRDAAPTRCARQSATPHSRTGRRGHRSL
jgi:hypothetical protein